MAKANTVDPNETNKDESTGEASLDKAKAGKKYFVELKRGLDSHAWAVLFPKEDSPRATLIAGTEQEVTKEVFDFISHPDRNRDVYNPQTQETEKLFKTKVV